jgi:hypothetical protein
MNLFTPWVLSLLVAIGQTENVTPEPDLADEIAAAAIEQPLPGAQGRERMAAVLVAIAWYESRLNRNAVGDHGQSLGLFQLAQTWRDPSAREAARLVTLSWSLCASEPLEHRLGWYAWGRTGCSHRHGTSAHRLALAARLLRQHPPPPSSE